MLGRNRARIIQRRRGGRPGLRVATLLATSLAGPLLSPAAAQDPASRGPSDRAIRIEVSPVVLPPGASEAGTPPVVPPSDASRADSPARVTPLRPDSSA